MIIDTIEFGRKNKKTREQLMKQNNINSIEDFNEQLAEAKLTNVILTNGEGYYRPTTSMEYENFIKKLLKTRETLNKKINLAYKELNQRRFKIRDLSNEELEKTKRMHNPWEYNHMSITNLKDKRNKLQDRLTMLQKMIDKSSKEENWACGRYSDQTRLLAKIELIDEMIKELWIYD